MVILSLCGGIECGAVAIKKLGIKIDKYYSSEIDKDAIKVASDNHPEIIHIGDIKQVSFSDGILYTEEADYDVGEIDIVFGGTPCKGFSCAGKRIDFEHEESKLFFEFDRILKEVNPKYFLFENVRMKEEPLNIISDFLKVTPTMIDSALVSPQHRKRNYWTNIIEGGISQPKDAHILFKDISIDDNYQVAAQRGRRYNKEGKRDNLLPIQQWIEPRFDNKTNCITTVSKDNVVIIGYLNSKQQAAYVPFRKMTLSEVEACQNLPIGYCKSVSQSKAKYMVGRGWTVDVICHILSFINYK